jgi:hypothetical protein
MMPAAQHPMKRAAVVGGVASFINETASKKLARWGFIVTEHYEMGKKRIPHLGSNIEAVIVFYDMVAHHQSAEQVKDSAERAGVPCLMLPRKESMWSAEMRRHGFEPINPNVAACVADAGEEIPMNTTKPAEKQAQVVPLDKRLTSMAAFMDRKETLRRLLREMVEKDGLKEVIFSPDSGMSLKRVAVEEFTEDV